MSQRKAKEARRATVAAPTEPPRARAAWWPKAAVGVAVVVVIAATFAVPRLRGDDVPSAAAHAAVDHGMPLGEGLPVGADVPAFSERDVMNDTAITEGTIAGRKTLLYFSEGVMCQACFEQIRDIEQVASKLRGRGIDLIGITPDPAETLQWTVVDFKLKTPMIADDDRTMSAAFNTLGKGMHPDTPGHAFVLVDDGKVVWQRDYWLEPYRTMYVEPSRLLADIPEP
jgi:peroxiredoxin